MSFKKALNNVMRKGGKGKKKPAMHIDGVKAAGKKPASKKPSGRKGC